MKYLMDSPAREACGTLILAHGAGAHMDSGFMEQITAELTLAGLIVVRFEFPYMVQQRQTGKRRPPDRPPVLLECWRQVFKDISSRADLVKPLLIGGKSMGGRIASMLADELVADGVCCYGYPFYPAGKPEKLRTAHLEAISTPVQIFQGTRDPMGEPARVASFNLSQLVEIEWLEDGDHHLKPRQRSGLNHQQHLRAVAQGTTDFARKLMSAC